MVIAAPAFSNEDLWPKSWSVWLKGIRQTVEMVYDKLENWFGLGRDRNHDLSGFHVRFATKVALHNFLIYLNQSLNRLLWLLQIYWLMMVIHTKRFKKSVFGFPY